MRTCLSPTLYSATWSSSESIKGCSLQALMHLVLPSSSGTQRILNLEIAKARSPVTDAVSEPSKALSAPLIFFFTRFTRPARQRRPGCDSADLCRDSDHHLRLAACTRFGHGSVWAWGQGAPRVPSPVRLAGLCSFSNALKNSSWPAPPSLACVRLVPPFPPPLGLPWQAAARQAYPA